MEPTNPQNKELKNSQDSQASRSITSSISRNRKSTGGGGGGQKRKLGENGPYEDESSDRRKSDTPPSSITTVSSSSSSSSDTSGEEKNLDSEKTANDHRDSKVNQDSKPQELTKQKELSLVETKKQERNRSSKKSNDNSMFRNGRSSKDPNNRDNQHHSLSKDPTNPTKNGTHVSIRSAVSAKIGQCPTHHYPPSYPNKEGKSFQFRKQKDCYFDNGTKKKECRLSGKWVMKDGNLVEVFDDSPAGQKNKKDRDRNNYNDDSNSRPRYYNNRNESISRPKSIPPLPPRPKNRDSNKYNDDDSDSRYNNRNQSISRPKSSPPLPPPPKNRDSNKYNDDFDSRYNNRNESISRPKSSPPLPPPPKYRDRNDYNDDYNSRSSYKNQNESISRPESRPPLLLPPPPMQNPPGGYQQYQGQMQMQPIQQPQPQAPIQYFCNLSPPPQPAPVLQYPPSTQQPYSGGYPYPSQCLEECQRQCHPSPPMYSQNPPPQPWAGAPPVQPWTSAPPVQPWAEAPPAQPGLKFVAKSAVTQAHGQDAFTNTTVSTQLFFQQTPSQGQGTTGQQVSVPPSLNAFSRPTPQDSIDFRDKNIPHMDQTTSSLKVNISTSTKIQHQSQSLPNFHPIAPTSSSMQTLPSIGIEEDNINPASAAPSSYLDLRSQSGRPNMGPTKVPCLPKDPGATSPFSQRVEETVGDDVQNDYTNQDQSGQQPPSESISIQSTLSVQVLPDQQNPTLPSNHQIPMASSHRMIPAPRTQILVDASVSAYSMINRQTAGTNTIEFASKTFIDTSTSPDQSHIVPSQASPTPYNSKNPQSYPPPHPQSAYNVPERGTSQYYPNRQPPRRVSTGRPIRRSRPVTNKGGDCQQMMSDLVKNILQQQKKMCKKRKKRNKSSCNPCFCPVNASSAFGYCPSTGQYFPSWLIPCPCTYGGSCWACNGMAAAAATAGCPMIMPCQMDGSESDSSDSSDTSRSSNGSNSSGCGKGGKHLSKILRLVERCNDSSQGYNTGAGFQRNPPGSNDIYNGGQQNDNYNAGQQNGNYNAGQQNDIYNSGQQNGNYNAGQQNDIYNSGQQIGNYNAGQQNGDLHPIRQGESETKAALKMSPPPPQPDSSQTYLFETSVEVTVDPKS